MLKKILLVVVVLLAAVGAFVIYGTYKVVDVTLDEIVKEHEPQIRQYMQLGEEEQNKYILDNADVIIKDMIADAKPEEKADMELMEKAKGDPDVQKALINLGRSVMARGILRLESDLSAEVKAKYKKEADGLKDKFNQYCEALDAAGKKLKAAQ